MTPWYFCSFFTQLDKFLPLHLRKKVWRAQRPPLPVFEMIPSSGVLAPGKRVNVQIKFSPTERVSSPVGFRVLLNVVLQNKALMTSCMCPCSMRTSASLWSAWLRTRSRCSSQPRVRGRSPNLSSARRCWSWDLVCL